MPEFASQVQTEAQRGLLLKVLVSWRMEWLPFSEMRIHVLRRLGYEVSDDQLLFHMKYLEAAGYAELKRLRAGRADYELTTVRATTKGVDLVEGRLPPDDGVAF
jgi:hypothetical protein